MKKVNKVIPLLLTGILLTGSSPVYALSKSETVYSKLNNDGSVKNTTVNELLKNDGSNKISDETNLKNILNINGEEKYTLDGTNLTWEANGNDIYYQGETEKELPVSLKISYQLNGKDISLKKLLGKKGNVTIKINYTNNDKHTTNVNGNYETLYTPFVVTLGTIINNTDNSNINVTNGKVVSNGTSSVVVALASPGLYESLGIDSLKDFDTITINYDTKNFKLNSIYSVVSSKLISEDDLDVFDKLDGLYSKVNTLSSSSKQLVSGSQALLEGSQALQKGSNTLASNLNNAYNGSNKITTTLNSSIDSLKNGSAIDSDTLTYIKSQAVSEADKTYAANESAIENQAVAVVDKNKDAIILKASSTIESNKESIESQAISTVKENEYYKQYLTATTDAEKAGIQSIIATCSKQSLNEQETETCNSYASKIADYKNAKQVMALMEGVAKQTAYTTAIDVAKQTAYATAVDTAKTTAKQTAKQTAETTASSVAESVAVKVASNAATSSISSLNTLEENLTILTSGLKELSNGANELNNGVSTLSSGINTLATGITTFDEQGIQTIANLINSDVKTAEAKIKSLVRLGNDYNTFTMTNTESETKFVLMVDAEQKASSNNNKKTIKNEKKSLWDKIKDLF